MLIVTKPYCEWDEKTQSSLKELTLPGGFMKKCISANPEVFSLVAFNGEIPIGWAIVADHKEGKYLQIFVSPKYRRRRVAILLAEEVLKHYEKIVTTFWDNQSEKFFKKLRRKNPGRVRVINYYSIVNSLEEAS